MTIIYSNNLHTSLTLTTLPASNALTPVWIFLSVCGTVFYTTPTTLTKQTPLWSIYCINRAVDVSTFLSGVTTLDLSVQHTVIRAALLNVHSIKHGMFFDTNLMCLTETWQKPHALNHVVPPGYDAPFKQGLRVCPESQEECEIQTNFKWLSFIYPVVQLLSCNYILLFASTRHLKQTPLILTESTHSSSCAGLF